MTGIKAGIETKEKKGLNYVTDASGNEKKYIPWLADSFSFVYDFSMSNSVFPKKFAASIQGHYDILRQALENTRYQNVLETGTGSGSAVHFLGNDNRYTGTDISAALLRQAVRKINGAGFIEPQFYLTGADDLPFVDSFFDCCLCILSLNFFPDAQRAFQEIHRTLRTEGMLLCSVPLPERKPEQSTIRGKLHTQSELAQLCHSTGFHFEPVSAENGALFYFKAIKLPD